MSNHIAKEIQDVIEGDVSIEHDVLEECSRDTSLFKVRPEIVVFPKNVSDVQKIVNFINENRDRYPKLSITGRSAGTDMSGGPLNESIILVFTKYFTDQNIDEANKILEVEPGVYFRDFEKKVKGTGLMMPTYPASKSLAAYGGMIMNNCGGEKTLRYGQMRDVILSLDMVLADGKTYTFKPLTEAEVKVKIAQKDFEAYVYAHMWDLIKQNQKLINEARPKTSKNSAGYALWDIWNGETFDLTQLFAGSQGTLGILSKAKIKLFKEKKHKKMITLFFKGWDDLPEVVNELLPHKPESLETFDDETMKLGLRFMPDIAKKVGVPLISFMIKFWPEVLIGLKMLGMPKLVVLVELAEDSEEILDEKIKAMTESLKKYPVKYRVLNTQDEMDKYWVMRRQSFALLREHVHGKQTAPFVDDFAVLPEHLPRFLPQMLDILKKYNIKATIAGHAGNGNLHIIPLMDLRKKSERDKIPVAADEIYKLIVSYGGTITAEHNDGIMRTPYLEMMYGKDVMTLFEEVKQIFDPQNIFNPGKKVGGTKEYLQNHITSK